MHSIKVILFGSVCRGEDYPDSDIDLFILSKDPENVAGLLPKAKSKRKIQAVIKAPGEYAAFEKNNPVFVREIECGIVLWEAKQ